MKKLLGILAVVCVLAGFFLIMSSKPIGVVLFIIGVGLGVVCAAMLLKRGGYSGDGAFFPGLGGQGRQQSEVVKTDLPQGGEQPADIWDKMTEDKK